MDLINIVNSFFCHWNVILWAGRVNENVLESFFYWLMENWHETHHYKHEKGDLFFQYFGSFPKTFSYHLGERFNLFSEISVEWRRGECGILVFCVPSFNKTWTNSLCFSFFMLSTPALSRVDLRINFISSSHTWNITTQSFKLRTHKQKKFEILMKFCFSFFDFEIRYPDFQRKTFRKSLKVENWDWKEYNRDKYKKWILRCLCLFNFSALAKKRQSKWLKLLIFSLVSRKDIVLFNHHVETQLCMLCELNDQYLFDLASENCKQSFFFTFIDYEAFPWRKSRIFSSLFSWIVFCPRINARVHIYLTSRKKYPWATRITTFPLCERENKRKKTRIPHTTFWLFACFA